MRLLLTLSLLLATFVACAQQKDIYRLRSVNKCYIDPRGREHWASDDTTVLVVDFRDRLLRIASGPRQETYAWVTLPEVRNEDPRQFTAVFEGRAVDRRGLACTLSLTVMRDTEHFEFMFVLTYRDRVLLYTANAIPE